MNVYEFCQKSLNVTQFKLELWKFNSANQTVKTTVTVTVPQETFAYREYRVDEFRIVDGGLYIVANNFDKVKEYNFPYPLTTYLTYGIL